MSLSSCKGNIVLEVAAANATRTLLERIQSNVASAITKDLGFYLGILPDHLVSPPRQETSNQLHLK